MYPATKTGVAFSAGVLLALALASTPARSQGVLAPDPTYVIGDERALKAHVDQHLVEQGRLNLPQLFAAGQNLFDTAFTELDGRGRPLLNGVFPPLGRQRREGADAFNRVSGPDSDTCSGCHNKPRSGGGG